MVEKNNEQQNILQMLIENSKEELNILQIAKIRKINYKSAYQAIERLVQDGCVNKKSVGKATICTFSRKLTPIVYAVESNRKNNVLKNKNIGAIYDHLSLMPEQCIILLFGSYAKNSQTTKSDIDILAISNNADKIEKSLNVFPFEIHATCLTYKQFLDMLSTRHETVVSEVLKRNIVLFGVEDYYRLLHNANATTN